MIAKPNTPDRSLFVIALSLVVLGVVMVFSASAVIARQRYGDANFFSFRQLMAGALGLASMFVLMKVDYHVYKKPLFVFSILSLVVGLCVLVFFLPATRNTHRWIQIPGISFQPSETAKLALAIFLAYFLELRKGQINKFFTLAPAGAIIGLLTGLIVAYGYGVEGFMAWYGGSQYEGFMMLNRLFGPYKYQYWALIFCNVIFPQLLWFKSVRMNIPLLFVMSIVVNIGMWLERFVIIVLSLHRDFLPSSWGMFRPTFWDWSTYLGTVGLFFTLFFLFMRLLPAISIFEMRTIVPEAKVAEGHGH